MKKHNVKIIFFLLGCVFCILIFILIKRLYYYYSWVEERSTNYHTSWKKTNDTLRTIIIGDSWAAYHHENDPILTTMLQERIHKPVHVVSSGMVGAKTKTVYELMFDSISSKGTKKLLSSNPDYCVIFAGINDAVAKMGVQNYCYHYSLIIRYLLSVDITPIILDVPNVDYETVYQRESITSNIRHHISSWFTNAPMWSFEEYRKALQTIINQGKYSNQIIYISSTEWNPKGFEDSRALYLEDHIHLNNRGYYLLDSCIATHISHDYITTRDSL